MRRLTVLAGALGAALLMSSAAFAQVPPDPANPNEAIPEASGGAGLLASRSITRRPKRLRLRPSRKRRSGTGTRCALQSSTRTASSSISSGKTTAARVHLDLAAQGAHCGALSASDSRVRTAARQGAFFAYLPTLDDVIASRGGNPLIVDGKIIGAVGASGGTGSQDDAISQAGVAGLK